MPESHPPHSAAETSQWPEASRVTCAASTQGQCVSLSRTVLQSHLLFDPPVSLAGGPLCQGSPIITSALLSSRLACVYPSPTCNSSSPGQLGHPCGALTFPRLLTPHLLFACSSCCTWHLATHQVTNTGPAHCLPPLHHENRCLWVCAHSCIPMLRTMPGTEKALSKYPMMCDPERMKSSLHFPQHTCTLAKINRPAFARPSPCFPTSIAHTIPSALAGHPFSHIQEEAQVLLPKAPLTPWLEEPGFSSELHRY